MTDPRWRAPLSSPSAPESLLDEPPMRPCAARSIESYFRDIVKSLRIMTDKAEFLLPPRLPTVRMR